MRNTFGMARGEHKVLDTAISKATNNHQELPKEKHIRTIFHALAPSRVRCDVVYCIYSLARRLGQTHNWTVALKTLIVIHRALRELDNSVWEEFIKYSRERGHMLNLSHFHDSSSPNAIEYSAWVRNYAFYLDERLRCFVMLDYDAVTYSSKEMKLDTLDLLEQMPSLQDLLYWLLECKPKGAASYHRLIQYALSIVAGESVKLYVTITVRVVNLLDKFFEMNLSDAMRALEIYKKSGQQGEMLSTFFETCRNLDFGKGQKFINIKHPPASFMTTLEEYVKEAPRTLMLDCKVVSDEQGATETEKAAPEGDLLPEFNQDGSVKENSDPSTGKNEVVAAPQAADLLGLDDLLTGASEYEQNSLALAIVPHENSLKAGNNENLASHAKGWELALFTEPTEPSSNEDVVANSKLAQGMERSTLDKGVTGTQHNGPYQMGHMGQVASNPFQASQGPFHASDNMALPTSQGAYYPPPPNMGSPTSQGPYCPPPPNMASSPTSQGAYYPPPPNMASSLTSQRAFYPSLNMASPPTSQGAFYPSPNMSSTTPVQLTDMSYQQIYMMQQQQPQQQQPIIKSTNPFE